MNKLCEHLKLSRLPVLICIMICFVVPTRAHGAEDDVENTLRTALVESFTTRRALLASGYLKMTYAVWTARSDAESMAEKRTTTKTLFEGLTNWLATVAFFAAPEEAPQKYFDQFDVILSNNMVCIERQHIDYWYDYAPAQIMERVSRAGVCNGAGSGDRVADEWLYLSNCLYRYVPQENRLYVSTPESQYLLPYFQINAIDPVFFDFTTLLTHWPPGRYAKVRKISDTTFALETEAQAKSTSYFMVANDNYYVYETRGESLNGNSRLYHAYRVYDRPEGSNSAALLPQLSVRIDVGPDFINTYVCYVERHDLAKLDFTNYCFRVVSRPAIVYDAKTTETASEPFVEHVLRYEKDAPLPGEPGSALEY